MACGEAAGQAAKDLPTVRLQGQMACGFPAHPISFVSLEHSASHSPGLPTCFQISDIEGQMLSFLLWTSHDYNGADGAQCENQRAALQL